MKYKFLFVVLVVLVSSIMLISNVSAAGWPPAWINQATLSTVDCFPGEDPEISGFGTTQVVVWEEYNGNDWDIYMKYSLADGALGTWVFPLLHPATTIANEINPAVTVTNAHPVSGATEIHVVYELRRIAGGLWQSDIYHTWTNDFGISWMAPTRLDNTPGNDATDPAVVYTEDLSNIGGLGPGWLVQIVWSEYRGNPAFIYEIYYKAHYYDPTLGRGYNTVAPTLVRGAPAATGDCKFPEIASVDETLTAGTYDYYFGIVWQEQVMLVAPPVPQWNVWYVDGTTTISPIPGGIAFSAPGQISFGNAHGDSIEPDIAATQDYLGPAAATYYYHVVYEFDDWVGVWQIDSCYSMGAAPTPGAASFIMVGPFARQLGVPVQKPTIASKVVVLQPTTFESWMCWEESSNVPGSNPDIWFRVGIITVGGPPFNYLVPPARVGYLPALGSIEHNPELWNRDDSTRLMPPFTHLVFDQDVGNGIPEIEYIDP